jgi:hypothetical protein
VHHRHRRENGRMLIDILRRLNLPAV